MFCRILTRYGMIWPRINCIKNSVCLFFFPNFLSLPWTFTAAYRTNCGRKLTATSCFWTAKIIGKISIQCLAKSNLAKYWWPEKQRLVTIYIGTTTTATQNILTPGVTKYTKQTSCWHGASFATTIWKGSNIWRNWRPSLRYWHLGTNRKNEKLLILPKKEK